MLIDLRNVKMENITSYEKINQFLENKGQGNPRPVYVGRDLLTQV